MVMQYQRSASHGLGSRLRRRVFGPSARSGGGAAARILIMVRSNGAVMVDRAEASAPQTAAGFATLVIFEFRSSEEADAVMAGARRRLASEARQADGWLAGVSARQAASEVKAEAKSLRYSFAVIHPNLRDAPIIGWPRHRGAWRMAVMVIFALIFSAAALIGLVIGLKLN